jgi:hypothetical protein
MGGPPSAPAPIDIAALLYNIYNACILKQRSIRATLEMHIFPAKVGAKYALGPRSPPECQISRKCQGENVKTSILHSDEV